MVDEILSRKINIEQKTRIPLEPGGELMCSGMVNGSCYSKMYPCSQCHLPFQIEQVHDKYIYSPFNNYFGLFLYGFCFLARLSITAIIYIVDR